MQNSSHSLFLEINNYNFIFLVVKTDVHNSFEVVHKLEIPLKGIIL